jgi:hypothetical protein
MESNWYVWNGRQELGPFSVGQLKQMVKQGRLQTEHKLLRDGTEKWLPATAVRGLFEPAAAAPAPARARTEPAREKPVRSGGSGRLGLIFMTLLFLAALAGAGWFFLQTQQSQADLARAEEKLRQLAANKPPSSDDAKPPSTEAADQLKAEVQKLTDKGKKDTLALLELKKSLAELQTKSTQDALVKTSLGQFQKEMQQRLEQQLKDRLAELDKKALAQEETIAAVRKQFGLGEADAWPTELIDKYALAADADAEKSVDGLAKYLTAPFRTDKEKVRSIYRWITDRVSYDVPTFLSNDRTKQSAVDVLVDRKAVCLGYANMFEKLCRLSDLEVTVISGIAPDSPKTSSPHAWNAVKIDGKWQLIDVTWSAGSLRNKAFEKKLNEVFYLPSPELMVLAHLPNEPKWQLLEPSLPEPDIRMLFTLPQSKLMRTLRAGANGKMLLQQALKSESFRTHLAGVTDNQFATLDYLGMLSGEKLLEVLAQEKFAGLVIAAVPKGVETVKVHKAPLSKELQAGSTLEVEVSGVGQAAIIMNGKFFNLTAKGNQFSGNVVLEPGDVKVGVVPEGKSNPFLHVLTYVVPRNAPEK